MTAVVLIALGLLLAVVVLHAARNRDSVACTLDELERHTQEIDAAAFDNLTDPAEDEFLRIHLSRSQFRALERQRLRAAADYIVHIAHNAVLLSRMSAMLVAAGNLEEAALARQMAEQALQVRAHALLALIVVYTRLVFPRARISVGAVAKAYQNLSSGMILLGRLHSEAKEIGRPAF